MLYPLSYEGREGQSSAPAAYGRTVTVMCRPSPHTEALAFDGDFAAAGLVEMRP
jgi:hypothetical protein